jgi:hypothetical protein
LSDDDDENNSGADSDVVMITERRQAASLRRSSSQLKESKPRQTVVESATPSPTSSRSQVQKELQLIIFEF